MKISRLNILLSLAIILTTSSAQAEQRIPSLYDAKTVYSFCSLFSTTQIQEKDWISKQGELDFLNFDNLQDWREAGICTGYIAAAVDSSILNPDVCFPKRAKFDQLLDVFRKYYEQNTHIEKLSIEKLPGIIVAVRAFNEKYKCN